MYSENVQTSLSTVKRTDLKIAKKKIVSTASKMDSGHPNSTTKSDDQQIEFSAEWQKENPEKLD